MSCKKIKLVAGDENPTVRIQLLDHDTGAAINILPEATEVYLRFRESGGTDTLFQAGPLTKIDGGVNGWVGWDPDPDDIDLDPALYEAQIHITGAAGLHTCRDIIHVELVEKFGAAP